MDVANATSSSSETLTVDANTYVTLSFFCLFVVIVAVMLVLRQIDVVSVVLVVIESAAVALYIFGVLARADSDAASVDSCNAIAGFMQFLVTSLFTLIAFHTYCLCFVPQKEISFRSKKICLSILALLSLSAVLTVISRTAFSRYVESITQCVPASNGPAYMVLVPCSVSMILTLWGQFKHLTSAGHRINCARLVIELVSYALVSIAWFCAYMAVITYATFYQILWAYLAAPVVVANVVIFKVLTWLLPYAYRFAVSLDIGDKFLGFVPEHLHAAARGAAATTASPAESDDETLIDVDGNSRVEKQTESKLAADGGPIPRAGEYLDGPEQASVPGHDEVDIELGTL